MTDSLTLLNAAIAGDRVALQALLDSAGQPGNIVASLATLATFTGGVTGTRVYVLDQAEFYTLERTNAFAISSPLIVAAFGGGNWFRRSKAYVVANFTMWVAGFNNVNYALGYTPGQLLVTGTVTPDIILSTTDVQPTRHSYSVVVDMLGNLWWNMLGNGTSNIYRINLKDTLQSGTPIPAVQLSIANFVKEIAFDKRNNLWVPMGSEAHQMYTPEQYAVSGTPTPTIYCQTRPAGFSEAFLMFDHQDNLWSAAFSGQSVIMVSREQLLFNSTLTQFPSVIWSGSNFVGPQGMAQAPNGLLWVAMYVAGAGFISAFDARNPSSGNPTPAVTLTSSAFVGVTDCLFDASGNLWALNFDNGQLLRIPVAQLGVSGIVAPDIVITMNTPTGGITGAESFNSPQYPNRSGLIPSGAPA
jgi:hypothetical protein